LRGVYGPSPATHIYPVAGRPRLMEAKAPLLAAVRVKGEADLRADVQAALRMLRLSRVHTATLLRSTPSTLGQLRKVKDAAFWGPIGEETLARLLAKRGRLVGDRRLTPEAVRETGYDSVASLAKALFDGEVGIADVEGLKPVFRLHPPKGGFKGGKEKSARGLGNLGDVGERVNEILLKMI